MSVSVIKLVDELSPEYQRWKARVVEFCIEDEPNYIANDDRLKEQFAFGASGGKAAESEVELWNETRV